MLSCYLAFACKQLNIDNINSDLDHLILQSTSTLEKERFVACLSKKVVVARAYLERKWTHLLTESTTIPDHSATLAHLHWNFMMHGMMLMGIASFNA